MVTYEVPIQTMIATTTVTRLPSLHLGAGIFKTGNVASDLIQYTSNAVETTKPKSKKPSNLLGLKRKYGRSTQAIAFTEHVHHQVLLQVGDVKRRIDAKKPVHKCWLVNVLCTKGSQKFQQVLKRHFFPQGSTGIRLRRNFS